MISFTKKKQNFKSLSNEAIFSLYQDTQEMDYFGEIYERYATLVYGVCLNILKNREDAKDVMMDTFEMLMEKIPKQEKINRIDFWIHTVTKNKCYIKIREDKKIITENGDTSLDERKINFFMENECFLNLYNKEDKKVNKIIMQAIEQLRREQQNCIKAFFLENLSYKQINKRFGYAVPMVKSHLQNGRRNLKVLLKETKIST